MSMQKFTTLSRYKQLPLWAIGLTALTCLLAILAWGNLYSWQLAGLSPYQLFPLFGLLAFSIMWSQYVVAALAPSDGQQSSLSQYFRYTGYLVLGALILHPGILMYQRFHEGYGLPPGSYLSYVAPSLKWVALLGTAALLIFLTYEFHRWFGQKPWWRFIGYATDAAMIAVAYHGLRLGQTIHGWYRFVWFFYGITLLIVLIHKYFPSQTRRSIV